MAEACFAAAVLWGAILCGRVLEWDGWPVLKNYAFNRE